MAPPGAVRIGDPFGSECSYDRLREFMSPVSGEFRRASEGEAASEARGGKACVNAAAMGHGFLVSTVVLLACVASLSFLGAWRDAPNTALALFLVAGLAWCSAQKSAERTPVSPWVVCGVALCLRGFALVSQLELTDDAYRYVWEGELAQRGISPYAWSPGDPALAEVRIELPGLSTRVAHPEVPAVYPPLVQGAATLAVWTSRALGWDAVSGPISILRLFLCALDVLVLWLLAALARRSGRGQGVLVAWAFCPLVVFEFAGSAHFDVLGVFLLLAALLALARADERSSEGREVGASLLVAGAIASKYLPLFVLPWIGTRRRGFARVGLVALFLALAFAPFLFLVGGERGFLGGLGHYRDRWEAASLVFRFVHHAASAVFEPHDGWTDPGRLARLVVALAWVAWAGFVVLRVRDRVRGTGLLIAGYLVLTPTLHPWYLVWVLPFAALSNSSAWMWLIAAAPILYVPLTGWQHEGRWVEPGWSWWVLALPFFALLLWPRPCRCAARVAVLEGAGDA